jgi:hypothetical protein
MLTEENQQLQAELSSASELVVGVNSELKLVAATNVQLRS